MAFLVPGSVLLIEPVEDRLFFWIGNAFSMVSHGETEILFFKEDFQVYGFSLAGVGHGVVHKDGEDLDDPVFVAADLGKFYVPAASGSGESDSVCTRADRFHRRPVK